MRLYSSSSEVFCNEIERRCSLICENFLSPAVFDSPTLRERFTNSVKIKTRKLQTLELVAVLSWFHKDQWIGWMIREELAMIIEEDEEKFFFLNFYLQSKAKTLIYLLETSRYHSDEFFGILGSKSEIAKVYSSVKFRFKPTGPVSKPQRRRGYKDKGSLKLAHEKRSIGPQVRLQQRLEEEKRARQDTLALLQGFLE